MSTPTHILIPYTEDLQEYIRAGEVGLIVDELIKGKHISLDEKDTSELARNHAESVLIYHSPAPKGYKLRAKNSYQQALKDLL